MIIKDFGRIGSRQKVKNLFFWDSSKHTQYNQEFRQKLGQESSLKASLKFGIKSIFLVSVSIIGLVSTVYLFTGFLGITAKAGFNYPLYEFPFRSGEVWQMRPYDVHRDRHGLALDFVPINKTLDVASMGPGYVERGCTTKDGMQTLVWVRTYSRGVDYQEKIGYFHLNPKTLTVKDGQFVRKGQILGQIATNLKDYSEDPCNLMSWYEPHLHISMPESAFPITIGGTTFEKPDGKIIFSGPVSGVEKYKGRNIASKNSLNKNWGGLFRDVRVIASYSLNIRQEPAGQAFDKTIAWQKGQISGGPVVANLGGVNYMWWHVNWDNGTSGWSAAVGLSPQKVVASHGGLGIRYRPGGEIIGRTDYGAEGILSSKIVTAEMNGRLYNWARISWNDGVVGWSAIGSNLVRVY